MGPNLWQMTSQLDVAALLPVESGNELSVFQSDTSMNPGEEVRYSLFVRAWD